MARRSKPPKSKNSKDRNSKTGKAKTPPKRISSKRPRKTSRTRAKGKTKIRRPAVPRLTPAWMRGSGWGARILRWLKRFGITVLVVLMLIWIGAWLWLSGTITRGIDNTQNWVEARTVAAGFTVDNLMVEGRVYTDAERIKSIMRVEDNPSLVFYDIHHARDALMALAWVQGVHVHRRYPNALHVKLIEHTPIAVYTRGDKKLSIINTHGHVIDVPLDPRLSVLIRVSGKGAPNYTPDLIAQILAYPDVQTHVTSARWVGNRRWDITTHSGVVIRLPEAEIGLALRRLHDAHVRDGVLDLPLKSIDLRDADRMSIRAKTGRARDYKAGSGA